MICFTILKNWIGFFQRNGFLKLSVFHFNLQHLSNFFTFICHNCSTHLSAFLKMSLNRSGNDAEWLHVRYQKYISRKRIPMEWKPPTRRRHIQARIFKCQLEKKNSAYAAPISIQQVFFEVQILSNRCTPYESSSQCIQVQMGNLILTWAHSLTNSLTRSSLTHLPVVIHC